MIVALPAHAKLNLSMAVHGPRPDGYHEVTTVLQAISLHDLLLAERSQRSELLGGHPDDLVLKALRALEAAVGRPLPARLRLVKRIPIGAGLGGGSSDAAATLRALTRLYGLATPLFAVASEVGADVPFFLQGGAAVAGGKGERLRPVPAVDGWFAVAWPGLEVSTQAVYRCWDQVGGEGENQLQRAALAVEPRLAEFAAGLPGWLMTGSGAAFFKPCQTRAEAEAAVAQLSCWTAVARPLQPWAEGG